MLRSDFISHAVLSPGNYRNVEEKLGEKGCFGLGKVLLKIRLNDFGRECMRGSGLA
ncbi:hypothetical protein [Methylophaga sp. OBS4]|uniref:hypothetical protein n=1 Tax=Methylophaga sp. OBS4 TaxID=2991935 RepID=UPI002256BE99|nr:hypothetical protein [Methylophaga sp. OBS4]MCX4187082.1 hypothetical protein [Methylophaga sp. OBS4]